RPGLGWKAPPWPQRLGAEPPGPHPRGGPPGPRGDHAHRWVAPRHRAGRRLRVGGPLAALRTPRLPPAPGACHPLRRRGPRGPPLTAQAWQEAEKRFAHREDFRAAFLPGGRAPQAGQLFRLPDQARSLRLIAESEGEAFYRGELAEAMAAHAAREGGLLTVEDLAEHESEWVEPLSVSHKGFRLWELPPNGQGLVALQALALLSPLDLGPDLLDGRRLHYVVEALRIAFADAYAHISEPASLRVRPEQLVDDAYLAERRRLLTETRNPEVAAGHPATGDTVYLCAADGDGMMVSFIQSNYMGFGSGVVVPGTGIALQNRGACFTMEEGHPNQVGPA